MAKQTKASRPTSEVTVAEVAKAKPTNGGARFVVEGDEVLDRKTKRRWSLTQMRQAISGVESATAFAETMNDLDRPRVER